MMVLTATLALMTAADAPPTSPSAPADAPTASSDHWADEPRSHGATPFDLRVAANVAIPVVAFGGLTVAAGAVAAGNGFTVSRFGKDAALGLAGEVVGALGGAVAGLFISAISNKGRGSALDGLLGVLAGAGLGFAAGGAWAVTLADPPSKPAGWLFTGTGVAVLAVSIAGCVALALGGDKHPELKVLIALLAPVAAASVATAVRSFAP
jgi:hypothetical protein